jgi:REP element-mobilizing transposase RayT
MSRLPRKKTNESIFHVMVRSIKEVPLFREDKDKEQYMNILKGYQKIYGFKVYAYCLMSNHGHFIIDINGADISKVMHDINFKYACIFNRKYERYGHLFQDRFKSIIVDSEEYLIILSAYIHNNPLDMKKYKECPERYKFSSLGVYLGLKKDKYEVLDEDFIMQLFGNDVVTARNNYYRYVFACNSKKFKEDVEFINEKTFYKSERHILVRDFNPDDIFEFISKRTGVEKYRFQWKHRKDAVNSRALAAMLMRSLCNYRCADICRLLGNITQSRVSKLCSIGYKLMDEDERYKNILYEFIMQYAA